MSSKVFADVGVRNNNTLSQWGQEGGIVPYVAANVNPASVDLRLGSSVSVWDEHLMSWSPTVIGEYTELRIMPNSPVLVSTLETIKMPHDMAGMILLKSSASRSGICMSQSGWIDPGFEGTLTLQLYSIKNRTPIIYGQRFCQLIMFPAEPGGDIYDGNYQGSSGVVTAVDNWGL